MIRTTRIQLLAATAAAAALYAVPAAADPTPPCNNGIGALSTECGTNSVATGDFSTAVGQLATATARRRRGRYDSLASATDGRGGRGVPVTRR